MNVQQAIARTIVREDLSFEEMREVMQDIMGGHATPAQIAGLLVALRMKGETVDEVTGAASVMRELATPVVTTTAPLLDTCGTGGDGLRTFNVSTATAFVAAAAGANIAKHGNRAASSASGSADVLEAAGARVDLGPEQVAHCIETVGIGFMFAPAHHGATRHAVGPRRELGTRTLFNVLGPLTNPASAQYQLMGVFSRDWLETCARVLGRLGVERAMVVHARDGLDEVSIAGPTEVCELRDGHIEHYVLDPATFGLSIQPLDTLVVADAAHSLAVIERVLEGQAGPAADMVCVNAAAAIYVSGIRDDLPEALALARDVIASGAAAAKLRRFVEISNEV